MLDAHNHSSPGLGRGRRSGAVVQDQLGRLAGPRTVVKPARPRRVPAAAEPSTSPTVEADANPGSPTQAPPAQENKAPSRRLLGLGWTKFLLRGRTFPAYRNCSCRFKTRSEKTVSCFRQG